jgi:CelD/BcsL family acetyltransferase involved in cellulose biosynthesis
MPSEPFSEGLPDEALVQQWDDLLEGNSRATVFQRPEWVVPRLPHGGKRMPWVLRLGEGALGVVPMYVEKRGDTLRYLRLVGADYEDAVFAPGKEGEAFEALLQAVRGHRRRWDIADFRSLTEESALLAGIQASPIRRGFSSVVVPHQRYAYVQLPPTWEAYEEHLGKKLAWQLRYEERRRLREFKDVVLRQADAATLDSDMQALFDLHTERWQGKGHAGFFSTEADRERFRTLARALLGKGRLRLYTLWLDGKPAGAMFCLSDGRRIYYYASGFAAEHAKHGPVKALIAQAIKDGIASGMSEFDFMKGEEDYKARWATHERQLYRLVIAPKRLRPQLALLTLKHLPAVKAWLKARKSKPAK